MADTLFALPAPTPIFISYGWGRALPDGSFPLQDKTLRLVAHAVRTYTGGEIWVDKERMGATAQGRSGLDDAMCAGIDVADTVVVCMSEAYANSKNCKKELEYAELRGKRLLFVNVGEPGWLPSQAGGWLLMALGKRLWSDCRTDVAASSDGGIIVLLQQLRRVGEAAPRVDSEAAQVQLRRSGARSSRVCCCFSSCFCAALSLLLAILFFFTAFVLAAIAPAVDWVSMYCNCPSSSSSTSSNLWAHYALDGSSTYFYTSPSCGSSLTPTSLLASQLPAGVDIAAAGREQKPLIAASAVLLFGCFIIVCFALLPLLCGCNRRVCCSAGVRDYEPFEDPRVIITLYRATVATFPAALLATTLLSIGASTFMARVMSFMGTVSGSSLSCNFHSPGSGLEIAGAILAPISLLPLAFALYLGRSWLFVSAVPEKGVETASASAVLGTPPAASVPSPQAIAVAAGAANGNLQLRSYVMPTSSGEKSFASAPAGDLTVYPAIASAGTCGPATHAANPDVLAMLHLVEEQRQLVAQQAQQIADFHAQQAQQRQQAQQTQQWHPQQPQQPWAPLAAAFVDQFGRPLSVDPHGNLFDANGRFVGRAPGR